MSIELLLTRAIPDDEADYIGSGSCDRIAGRGWWSLKRKRWMYVQPNSECNTQPGIPRRYPIENPAFSSTRDLPRLPKGEFSERTSPPGKRFLIGNIGNFLIRRFRMFQARSGKSETRIGRVTCFFS